ncbi:glycosyltransferase [Clostridium tyrobutyricum]|uniref:glycosyltransferase n=1 Tax=Clostridium tyrobutyricum TaxID=1519 RepID=UPI00057C59EA|nr:glycosyltransferase [Clostridium tyrobutyricum]
MRVLFCIRKDYLENFAGDSMQFIKTLKYLKKRHVDIHINKGSIKDYSNYDIVHLFNLTRIGETYNYYKIARFYKKNIVLTPIYWNLKKYYSFVKDEESIKLWNESNIYRKEILQGCSMIYPNSILEAEQICSDFSINVPYTVVYNGIELEYRNYPKFNFRKKYSLRKYILCAARICNRKNQLVLSRILKDSNYDLVLIGDINDEQYFMNCMKYRNVKYLGFMDRCNLYNAYRCADIHILPSFVETPGLSSLEAASLGCKIISTEEGSSREYFRDMCIYCNPYNEDSIKKSIEYAIGISKNSKLKKYVNNNFNWKKCIDTLYDSYINLIN